MKGDASAEQIAILEDIFELNRNTDAIEQMREDVETYEEAVRKQDLKSKLQKNKNPKPSPLRQSRNSQRIILNQRIKEMAQIRITVKREFQ